MACKIDEDCGKAGTKCVTDSDKSVLRMGNACVRIFDYWLPRFSLFTLTREENALSIRDCRENLGGCLINYILRESKHPVTWLIPK